MYCTVLYSTVLYCAVVYCTLTLLQAGEQDQQPLHRERGAHRVPGQEPRAPRPRSQGRQDSAGLQRRLQEPQSFRKAGAEQGARGGGGPAGQARRPDGGHRHLRAEGVPPQAVHPLAVAGGELQLHLRRGPPRLLQDQVSS